MKKHQPSEKIKILNHKIDPDILILLETMTNKINTDRIISRLGYEHFDYVLPENHCGGIWILWNNVNISAQDILKEQRVIHMLIHDKLIPKESIMSAIYDPAQEIDEDAFWNHLMGINTILDLPWFIIGDFNEMKSLSDKTGGTHLTLHKVVVCELF